MVTIFNKNFSSVVEALLYFGWSDESQNVRSAPVIDGTDFSTTAGTYEMLHVGADEKLVWVRDEGLWNKHTPIRGVDAGLETLDGEELVEVCLRQAIDAEGTSHLLLSVWSQNTTAGGAGFINFALRENMVITAEGETPDGEDRHLCVLYTEGMVLVYTGNAVVAREAKMMAYHLLKQ